MSMRCSCGARACCIDSRYKNDSRETRRRYKCSKRKCARRWTTIELVAPGRKGKGWLPHKSVKRVVEGRITADVVADIRREVLAMFRKRKNGEKK